MVIDSDRQHVASARVRQRPPTRGSFVKGDKRCNRSGKPKTFHAFRDMVQRILNEVTTDDKDKRKRITRAEKLVRECIESKEPTLRKAMLEYAYGKVPEKIDATGLENRTTLVLYYAHERNAAERASATDGETTLTLKDRPNETQ